MPRAFFTDHVLPNYRDWLADPLNERLAKNAVGDANNMAERVFHYWQSQDPSKIHNAAKVSDYRDSLAQHECPDFALVRDVADAHKHVTLSRPSRQLTRSDQTGQGTMGYGEGGSGEGTWSGTEQLVVTLDDGSKRPLTAIMKNVIEMWDRLLSSWGL